jgi:hypothetical protein
MSCCDLPFLIFIIGTVYSGTHLPIVPFILVVPVYNSVCTVLYLYAYDTWSTLSRFTLMILPNSAGGLDQLILNVDLSRSGRSP